MITTDTPLPRAMVTPEIPAVATLAADDVLGRLHDVIAHRDLDDLGSRIAELRSWIASDLAEVEVGLNALELHDTPMHGSAHHLLSVGGKRLRPMCVALAARVGTGFTGPARDLAIAAELVHNATLLHDDVVDLGDTRRGAPTARTVYGNTASVYAGDWLLVEALDRIQRAGIPGLLDRAIGVLKEILNAESLQLANRGKVNASARDYFRVVEGKTASLFRWALYAGARAGELTLPVCDTLEQFGQTLGVAFQVVDDVLDLAGDPDAVGKSMFGDLREGKMTYPLMLAVERDPTLGEVITTACTHADQPLDPALQNRVVRALRETGAIEDSQVLARKMGAQAIALLYTVPACRARNALENIAVAMIQRRS